MAKMHSHNGNQPDVGPAWAGPTCGRFKREPARFPSSGRPLNLPLPATRDVRKPFILPAKTGGWRPQLVANDSAGKGVADDRGMHLAAKRGVEQPIQRLAEIPLCHGR